MVGCGAPVATPTALPPTATSVPPTDTPTAVPPTAAATAASADSSWTTRADMPTGRWELATCVVEGKIYAIGGAGPAHEALNTVEEYDPGTDTWTTKSEMPTARVCHHASVVDGRIYIVGGSDASTPDDRSHALTVEVYDPATDTWTQEGDMPASRAAGFSSVVDGRIYVIGGYGGSQRVDEYDPATGTWTTKSAMPSARRSLSTSALDGKIYAFGGYVPGVPGHLGVVTVEVYDPATDTWTTVPDMPTGRFGLRTSVVDGKIYVIGGMDKWVGSAYRTVLDYDP